MTDCTEACLQVCSPQVCPSIAGGICLYLCLDLFTLEYVRAHFYFIKWLSTQEVIAIFEQHGRRPCMAEVYQVVAISEQWPVALELLCWYGSLSLQACSRQLFLRLACSVSLCVKLPNNGFRCVKMGWTVPKWPAFVSQVLALCRTELPCVTLALCRNPYTHNTYIFFPSGWELSW